MSIIGSENQVIIVILKANIWLSGYIYKMSGVRRRLFLFFVTFKSVAG